MNNQKIENAGVGDCAKPKASTKARKSSPKAHRRTSGEAAALEARNARNSVRVSSAKQVSKSKKDQLIGLLSKPNGTRVSVIVEKLGWQSHTVRAALSGLRKQGFKITTSRSPKTGETIYTLLPKSELDASVSTELQA